MLKFLIFFNNMCYKILSLRRKIKIGKKLIRREITPLPQLPEWKQPAVGDGQGHRGRWEGGCPGSKVPTPFHHAHFIALA